MNLRKIWKPPADSLVSAVYTSVTDTGRDWGRKGRTGTTEIFDYDRSKLILSTLHSSLNGPELAGILRRNIIWKLR